MTKFNSDCADCRRERRALAKAKKDAANGTYEKVLAGIVALPDRMQCSLVEFARRLRVYMEREQSKLSPDNGLIALLCDAGRLGWENIEMFKAQTNRSEGCRWSK